MLIITPHKSYDNWSVLHLLRAAGSFDCTFPTGLRRLTHSARCSGAYCPAHGSNTIAAGSMTLCGLSQISTILCKIVALGKKVYKVTVYR